MTFPQFAYRNVVRNKRTYAAYFLSSAFSVMIFFVYALFIFHPGIQEGVTSSGAIQGMKAAEIIIYIFSFFFVLYSVGSFLKSRKREFGILMMHGMTRNQLNRLVFLENMLIGVGSIVVGIGGGLITGNLFLMIGASVIEIDQLSFHLSWRALTLTIGAFLLLFLLISLFTTALVRTNKLIELMQSGQKPKTAPKVSILLSLVATVLLIASYYLAATATKATVPVRFFPVVGMTIVGTYFFYTQLSVFIMKRLQKNRSLFRKRTNMILISSLAYRLKDNARMFFMVTIISTVAFCAVGTLASTNVLTKQFGVDYPAAISYLANDEQPIHQQNLQQIRTELEDRKLDYATYEVPIKYVAVASATESHAPENMPVIAFSEYRNMSIKAGFDFTEQPLTGQETLAMRQHQTDYYDDAVYTLKQDSIKLDRNDVTDHVVLPRQLVEDEGLIVSDQLYAELTAAKTVTFTGFYVEEFKKTAGIGRTLTDEGSVFPSDRKPYAMAVSGTLLDNQISLSRTMLFVALLVGAVFFIASGSFLYFRLYADLDYDRRQFLTIKKVGLTDEELNSIVTRQLVLLFFVPIVTAVFHSAFAFMALQNYFTLSIAPETIGVLAGFIVAQVIYFFFIRQRYLRNLKKSLI